MVFFTQAGLEQSALHSKTAKTIQNKTLDGW